MRVVTAAEMRAIDKEAIEGYGIPEQVLMELAGLALARRAEEILNASSRRRVVVFAGKGNNGGDGFVAARHLHNRGAAVRVVITDAPERLGRQCAEQFRMAQRLGIETVQLTKDSQRKVQFHAAAADLLIDALLGTGSSGPPKGAVKTAIEIINAAERPVLAADMPSGVDADTGAAPGAAVRADATVTFGLPKIGLLIAPGRELAGRWTVADIGLPRALLEGGPRRLVLPGFVRTLLPARPPGGHKGTFGRVVIVGGSVGMAGAPTLAAWGAQRVGAGLVVLAGPEALLPVFASNAPEAVSVPLPQVNGTVAASAAERVLEALDGASVLVIGPGLGRSDDVRALVTRVLAAARERRVPAVVDADGLNALADAGVLPKAGGPGGGGGPSAPGQARLFPAGGADDAPALVLTPHPGEMARLCGVPAAEVAARPVELAETYARAWHAVVVLKGSPTVVADPSGRVFINSTGTAGLASGGSGDVLAGAVGGLIAQGASPADAAVAAVYVHGAAGEPGPPPTDEFWAARPHDAGLTAGDTARRLPRVLAWLRGRAPLDAAGRDFEL